MISVVIPAYNEQEVVGQTIGEVQALAARLQLVCEIVVVDDGSTDGTAGVVEALGVKVVRHPHNLGYGRALKDGIEAASHDTIIIIDADGTYPVADIPRLLETYGKGFDMVVGVRSGVGLSEPMFKVGLRAVLKLLVEFTAGRRVPDVNSGLRVFGKSTVSPYLRQLCDTFSFTTSLTLAYMMTGRFVAYVPIDYGRRVGRTKVRLFRDTLRTLQYIVQAIVYFNPAKMFLLLSAVCLLSTLVLALALLAVDGTAAVIVMAIGIVGAVGVFGLGLVADLLRQIMQK